MCYCRCSTGGCHGRVQLVGRIRDSACAASKKCDITESTYSFLRVLYLSRSITPPRLIIYSLCSTESPTGFACIFACILAGVIFCWSVWSVERVRNCTRARSKCPLCGHVHAERLDGRYANFPFSCAILCVVCSQTSNHCSTLCK